MKHLVVFILLLAATAVLWRCHGNDPTDLQEFEKLAHNIDTMEHVENRIAAIQRCAKCHQTEYENWLKGPHANAYKGLLEHMAYIDTSSNFSEDYRTFLPDRFETICASCHTGQNIFETSFNGLAEEQDANKFNKSHYPKMHEFAQARNGDQAKVMDTGVDCLTCHKSGDKIVTHGTYKPSGKASEGQCDLVASPFFSTNQSCYSCHHWQVTSMESLVKHGDLKSEQNCLDCHIERDESGQSTHYFYWRKDPADKKRPATLNVFHTIKTEAQYNGRYWQIDFEWANTTIPHAFSECGDAVARVEVVDKRGNVVKSFEKRVNMKSYLSKNEVAHFQEGEKGRNFGYNEPPIKHSVVTDKALEGGVIRVIGLVKPQYWSKDAELEEVYRHETPIR